MIKYIKYVVLFFLLIPTTLDAQNNQTRFFIAYDFANLTVDATAGGVPFPADSLVDPAAPAINVAQLVTFSVSCASGTDCNARFTVDGTAPTTTVGVLVQYGQIISIFNQPNLNAFRAIRAGATSAVFNVQYFR